MLWSEADGSRSRKSFSEFVNSVSKQVIKEIDPYVHGRPQLTYTGRSCDDRASMTLRIVIDLPRAKPETIAAALSAVSEPMYQFPARQVKRTFHDRPAKWLLLR
jgi:hypothetical protein